MRKREKRERGRRRRPDLSMKGGNGREEKGGWEKEEKGGRGERNGS